MNVLNRPFTPPLYVPVCQHVSTWQPGKSVPSPSFKALCKQLNKLHESTADVWDAVLTEKLFEQVRNRLTSDSFYCKSPYLIFHFV